MSAPRTDSVRRREEADSAELVAVPAGSGVAGIDEEVRRPEAGLAAAGRFRVRTRGRGEQRRVRGEQHAGGSGVLLVDAG